MTGIPHNSPKKNRFIGAKLSGLSIAHAAQLAEIPQSTAKKIWSKYKKTGSTANRPCGGCQSKVTERVKRAVVRAAWKYRRVPFQSLGDMMEPKLSASTVRRILAESGYQRQVARRQPFLTALQKKKRREWAWLVKGFEWSLVIFSDECYVYLDDQRGHIYVTRRADEEFKEDCLIPTFTQSHVRLMIWGCIMKGRRGPLVVLEYPGGRGGGMTAERYQEQVLEETLLPFWKEMRSK